MSTLAASPSRYPDLPLPRGQVVAEYRVAAGSALAYPVAAGQYIEIIDVAGAQCSDFLAFAGDRYEDELDSTATRTLNGTALPQAGLHSRYFSQQLTPLVEVVQDTCGRHDSFLLACTTRYYEEAGYPSHPSCSENFNRALAAYGIAPRPGWPAVNFFFNTEVQADGVIAAAEAWSRPGDYVLLRAYRDLLCASSACPDDIDPANGWQPTDIHVRIYAASEQFAPAMGRRVAADLPLRLTQASGFTSAIRQQSAHLVEYGGFWLPACFTHQGDQAEYWALRQRVTICDLSALRKFDVTGPDALNLLQWAFSRNLEPLALGQAAYGCLLTPAGGIFDDGIVFRLGPDYLRYVGNCDSDGRWLQQLAAAKGFQATVEPVSDRCHNVAVQGPRSRDLLSELVQLRSGATLDDLAYFQMAQGQVGPLSVLVSRTGYTGELGYELFVHPQAAAALWQRLQVAGQPYGLLPMGLQALDRARIEAGLLAAGREFTDLVSPYQAGIGWAVALKTKPDFIGRAALEQIRPHPPRVAVGLVLAGNEVATGGEGVYAQGDRWRVGQVTSGTFSPVLNCSIAMAQVVPEAATAGTVLEVGLLDGLKRRVPATVGPLAAYDPGKQRVRC